MKMPRARAPLVVLLVAFLVAGYGLPLADTLLFHREPGSPRVPERLLSDGNDVRTHVLVCHLGDGAALGRGLATAPQVVPAAAPPVLRVASVLDTRFVAASDLALPLSRGPPAA